MTVVWKQAVWLSDCLIGFLIVRDVVFKMLIVLPCNKFWWYSLLSALFPPRGSSWPRLMSLQSKKKTLLRIYCDHNSKKKYSILNVLNTLIPLSIVLWGLFSQVSRGPDDGFSKPGNHPAVGLLPLGGSVAHVLTWGGGLPWSGPWLRVQILDFIIMNSDFRGYVHCDHFMMVVGVAMV